MLGSIVGAYLQSFGFYREHYLISMQKYGVSTPLRWQDIVWRMVFWPLAIGSLYASYRLLKYGFRGGHSLNCGQPGEVFGGQRGNKEGSTSIHKIFV
jgi:hypothetical protein